MPARTQPVSIEDILSRTNEWENVTLSGKVVRVGDISTVGAKQLKLAETMFADSTGTIVVDICEQHIPTIENGKFIVLPLFKCVLGLERRNFLLLYVQ